MPKLPHPIVLLTSGVLVAALLTWVLPAGEFQRIDDAATGRSLVVPDTYTAVARAPVGLLGAAVSIPRGIQEAADVIAVILLVGGAWSILDRVGALRRLVGRMVGGLGLRRGLVIALVSVLFASLGATTNMQEEIIPLIPVLLILGAGIGIDAVAVVAMSAGAAMAGSAFGPANPFQAALALKIAELPPQESLGIRVALLIVAVAMWIAWTMYYAGKSLAPVTDAAPEVPGADGRLFRDLILLGLGILPVLAYIVGSQIWNWGFNELSGVYVIAAVAIGIIGGLGISGTTTAYLEGMQTLLPAALLVGVARSISVVLDEGRVLDTILNGMAVPLSSLPSMATSLLMIPFHAVIHIPVPSVSGQAVLTMPIMTPLADLLELPRVSAVIAYTTGAGLADFWSPTNGALLAILMAAKVRYSKWLAFALPAVLLLTALGMVAITMIVLGGPA